MGGVDRHCSSGRHIHGHAGTRSAHGHGAHGHGDGRLLIEHSHRRQRHVVEDRVCRDAISWRAGEGGRLEGVVPWVSTTYELAIRHVWETESGVSGRVDDENTATLHSKVESCFPRAGFARILI